jgi:hypothetical protein
MLTADFGLAVVGAGCPSDRLCESAGLDGWFEITIRCFEITIRQRQNPAVTSLSIQR